MKKVSTLIFMPLLILGISGISVFFISKNQQENNALIAKKYCGNCHQFPNPTLLTKKMWQESVLPEMGHRMGIGDRNELLNRMSFQQFQRLCSLNIYPEKSIITKSDWQKIVRYYIANAPNEIPESLSKPTMKSIENPFSILTPANQTMNSGQTTSVRFVPQTKEIWIGKYNRQIEIFDLNLNQKYFQRTPGPVVASHGDEEPLFLSIGNMTPNEDKEGILYQHHFRNQPFKPLATGLRRPVAFEIADLDQDTVSDIIIAEFGFETGQLSWINGKTGIKNQLSNLPGARNIQLEDINKDGKMDFYVLFAQANEQIVLYINKGNGQFQSQTILTFPAVFGSSFLEMADINKDGKKDIILTNGDNADYSPETKNFHGIHLYENKGNQQFKLIQFIAVAGATKTISKDFDGDGHLDLATIAFFSPNDKSPSFLYFKILGNEKFIASHLGIPKGQWMTMEADDMDADGDIDLLLGHFTFGKFKQIPSQIPFLVLKNNTIP
jgi:hypothetical protein